MQHPLDYFAPDPPKAVDGRRADVAALSLLVVTGAIMALLACGGSVPAGLFALLPFALIGTILAIVGVVERRGSVMSVTVLIGNVATLLLSISGSFVSTRI
jgi:hypothetical protein